MAGWRPPQWSQPAMVSLTVPSQQSVQQDSNGNLKVTKTASTTYVFDAVLRLNHVQRVTKTRHPVQTGADLSSHAYIEPAQLSMHVGMSDVMDAYASGYNSTQPPYITPFTGNPSKSVAAYQQMITLMEARQPLNITTRLRSYKNMIITSVEPEEDFRTITGLRMRVDFEQIFTASVAATPDSARSNDTDSTGLGVVNSQTPDTATVNQFNTDQITTQAPLTDQPVDSLMNFLRSHPAGVDVPGAGNYSSVNTNNLQQLPSP